jgi:hypothetical protein
LSLFQSTDYKLIINQIQECVFVHFFFSDATPYQICHQTRNHKDTNKLSSHLFYNGTSDIISRNSPLPVLYIQHIMPCLRTNAEDFLISKVAHNHKIHPALSQVSVSVVAERLTTHDRRTLHTVPVAALIRNNLYWNMPSGRKKRCFTRWAPSQRHRQQPDNLPIQQPKHPFVCRVCHFHAFDASGLRQHLSNSMHCSSSRHSILSLDIDADDNCNHNSNNMVLLDEDSSGGDIADEYKSDSQQEEEVVDELLRACALSHTIDWSTSSEEEEEEVNDDDQQQLLTKNNDKYEYYNEKDFPASPDDTAHVYLADLCRRIWAPLYAYDEICSGHRRPILAGIAFLQMPQRTGS